MNLCHRQQVRLYQETLRKILTPIAPQKLTTAYCIKLWKEKDQTRKPSSYLRDRWNKIIWNFNITNKFSFQFFLTAAPPNYFNSAPSNIAQSSSGKIFKPAQISGSVLAPTQTKFITRVTTQNGVGSGIFTTTNSNRPIFHIIQKNLLSATHVSKPFLSKDVADNLIWFFIRWNLLNFYNRITQTYHRHQTLLVQVVRKYLQKQQTQSRNKIVTIQCRKSID